MNDSAQDVVEAWLPRSLLSLSRPVDQIPAAGPDGLTAVRLRWRHGRLLEPEPITPALDAAPSWLVLPRLVDPHVHLDKAFTWRSHPNPSGTYAGAMAANLEEHTSRTRADVCARGERALQMACTHGLRAMRSHIDSLGPGADASWDALTDLKQRWLGVVDLQLVALVPIDAWESAEGESLARRVAACGGLLGGVVVPPWDGADVRRALMALLRLAERTGCAVDLHIDESDSRPAEGVRHLLAALDQVPVSVPITCSHASSLGLLPGDALARLATAMAERHLDVVALPRTNGWLLARNPGETPVLRPLAPIRQLQQGGVRVAVGGDNVADPWFPGGCFDPLDLLSSSLPLAQLAPWQRLGLAPFTTAAAAVMHLPWDGMIAAGAPADLLMLRARDWSEALMGPAERRVLIRGQWLTSATARPQA